MNNQLTNNMMCPFSRCIWKGISKSDWFLKFIQPPRVRYVAFEIAQIGYCIPVK